MTAALPTLFAPAEKSSEQCIDRQRGYFAGSFITRHLLDSLPGILLVMNGHRQVVYANPALMQLAGKEAAEHCFGMRLGDLLCCSGVVEAESGCGTGERCRYCGAVLAMLAGLSGRKDVQECRFARKGDGRTESFELRVNASPLDLEGEQFVVMSIADISHEKRRKALERIFFHDVLNLMGSVKGFSELLQHYRLDNVEEISGLIHEASEQVIDEIEAQRTLLAAENGDLSVKKGPLEVSGYLHRLVELYQRHEVAKKKLLVCEPQGASMLCVTDATLLGRILGNMLKNALEATPRGGVVSAGCVPADGGAEFFVHNQGVIPEQVQLQLFQRSFSTKGHNRGLGTYSMKLLSDYIGARVSFISSPSEGTTFRLWLPASPGASAG